MNYYNENDPKAVEWLRYLIRRRFIPDGDIDERSIREVKATELLGYVQCHFFAGIGGWPYALRLAGWPDDEPVWTGSCPCQPFSTAGQRKGAWDVRHLWPVWLRIIAEYGGLGGFPVIFGEQVASAAGRVWLSGVRSSLEALGRRVGASDLCAAGTGAPHRRQRLWWVADTEAQRRHWQERSRPGGNGPANGCGLGHTQAAGLQERVSNGRVHSQAMGALEGERPEQANVLPTEGLVYAPGGGRSGANGTGEPQHGPGTGCDSGRMVNPNGAGSQSGNPSGSALGHGNSVDSASGDVGLANTKHDDRGTDEPGRQSEGRTFDGRFGFWAEHEWLQCLDGKQRRTKPGIHPLASRLPGRVQLLRGYGNSIVPQVAAEFILAYLET